ncbi:hypothetical protein ACIBQ0_17065 [Nocardia nova]|uniref:hypothetical protein n=1 Tax=Nocardia nova TaxID=37330 RepID=UPI0037973170
MTDSSELTFQQKMATLVAAANASAEAARKAFARTIAASAPKPSRPRATYRMADHSRWGDNIEWFRMPNESGQGRIHGHMRQRPQPGDHIVCPMKSGKDGIFEVMADGNNYPYDPPDQFFVNVMFAGYEGEARP